MKTLYCYRQEPSNRLGGRTLLKCQGGVSLNLAPSHGLLGLSSFLSHVQQKGSVGAAASEEAVGEETTRMILQAHWEHIPEACDTRGQSLRTNHK
jgi:hypothetical protein